jgi:hypothetical protein
VSGEKGDVAYRMSDGGCLMSDVGCLMWDVGWFDV